MPSISKYVVFASLAFGFFFLVESAHAVSYQNLTVLSNPVVANARDKQAAVLTLNANSLSEIRSARIYVNYTGQSTNPPRGNFMWSAAGGFQESGPSTFGNEYVVLLPQDANNSPANSQINVNGNGTITFTFRWTLNPQYGNMIDNDISYYFVNSSGRITGWTKVDTNFEVNTNGVQPITYDGSSMGATRVQTNAQNVQTATVSYTLSSLSQLSSVQVINNYPATASSPYRGRFQWTSARGFEKLGSPAYAYGNDQVNILTTGPNASSYQVQTINSSTIRATFNFRWTINSTSGPVFGSNASYTFVEVNGFMPTWARIGTYDIVTSNIAPTVSAAKDAFARDKTVQANSIQTIGQYVVRNNGTERARLTNANIKFTGSFNVPTMLHNLILSAGTTTLGSTIASVANTSNNFNFGLDFAPGESKLITLKAFLTPAAAGSVRSVIDSISALSLGSNLTATNATDVTGQLITIDSSIRPF